MKYLILLIALLWGAGAAGAADENRENRDSREAREAREPREARETREPREAREATAAGENPAWSFQRTADAKVATAADSEVAGAVMRPVNSAFVVEAGSSHLLDSYLSPLHYTGWHVGLSYERTQAMKFSPRKWRQQLRIGAIYDDADNPSGNASIIYASVNAGWGMSRMWKLPHNLWVSGGGIAMVNLGAMYASRNSNNPVGVKADITLGITGEAGWKVKLGRLPVDLRWQTTLPLIGAMFSQEYDELYYEIYLGNHHGLAHCAYPGNLFRWNNLLTADLAVSATRIRVGFRSDIFSSSVNHITTRNFSYAFVLGVVTDWVCLSPRAAKRNDVITAY